MKCRTEEYLKGRVTPRRCERCGLGPCELDLKTMAEPGEPAPAAPEAEPAPAPKPRRIKRGRK